MSAAGLVDRHRAAVLGQQAEAPGDSSALPALPALQSSAQAQRPELAQLSASLDAVTDQRRLAQTRYLPAVSLVLEGGIQGTDYGFDGEQRFGLASVVLQWNLFNGFRDRARIRQADLDARQIRVRQDDVARRIDLQVQQALDDVRVAQRSLRTAEARVKAAASSFRLTKRRYDVGRANLVTFTDAQSTLTEAELNLAVTRFSLLTRLAELRFAAGLRMTNRAAP
jgi:outer membrane protein TolC